MCTVSPECFLQHSKLEQAMDTLVEVFQTYSDKTLGNDYTLSRTELQKLIEKELSHHVKRSWDPLQMSRLMCSLDKNRDGTICFEELVFLITRVILFSHPHFKSYKPNILMCGQMDYQ